MSSKRTLGLLVVLALAGSGLALAFGFTLITRVLAAWADVDSTSITIADFTLPAGYTKAYVVDLGDVQAIGYDGADGRSHIVWLQGPFALGARGRDLRVATPQAVGSELTLIEVRPLTVRGQAATLSLAEGVSGDGTPFREATVAFEGRGGPALLVVTGPAVTWDAAGFDALVESIR